MATLMLEKGADIRFLQAMLGHEELSITQIYTQVSIVKLKQIHTLTHPARLTLQGSAAEGEVVQARQDEQPPEPTEAALMQTLQAEAQEED